MNIWAVNLGFLVKLKRPPKFNQDGSKTVRVYCATFKKSKPLPNGLFSGNSSTLKQDEEMKSVIAESQTDSLNNNIPKCCNFALTFKSDPNTDCWLLYQEYGKDQMMHLHYLEWETFQDIREYVAEYTDKVRSLVEMKDLIY